MSFVEAVRTCLFRKYFEFQGRASRAEYWWFRVFAAVIEGAVSFAASTPVEYLVMGILVVPELAVTARRLHDTDRSAWWLLLSASRFLFFVSHGDFRLIGWPAALLLFVFMVQKGNPGENRYGPNPAPDATLDLGRLGFRPPPTRD